MKLDSEDSEVFDYYISDPTRAYVKVTSAENTITIELPSPGVYMEYGANSGSFEVLDNNLFCFSIYLIHSKGGDGIQAMIFLPNGTILWEGRIDLNSKVINHKGEIGVFHSIKFRSFA